MAQFPKFDEEFKQNVSEKFRSVKEKVSDAILTEDGSLDTGRISDAVTGTAKKVEDNVREGYRKFSEAYVKNGSLDKEKLGETVSRTYRNAGRSLATSVNKLAGFLTDKFGVQGQSGGIVDTEIVSDPFDEVTYPASEEPVEVTAEPEDFVQDGE